MPRFPIHLFALASGVAVIAACGSDTLTATSGLSGIYTLRSVAGSALPYSPASCGGSCTLASGSLEVLAGDTVLLKQTTTTPSVPGIPGTVAIASGHFILHRVTGGFSLELGPDITLGHAVDTLRVRGDTLIIGAALPAGLLTGRVYTR